MLAPAPRLLWALLALAAVAIALTSVALAAWFALEPCHLCIVQRTVFFLLALLAALAAWQSSPRRAMRGGGWGALAFLALAAFGGAVAAYQSWLQRQPPSDVSCVAGPLGPLERLVEWLGERLPSLFLATGFCEDAQLTILGLSLANWAFVCFVAVLATGAWALWRSDASR